MLLKVLQAVNYGGYVFLLGSHLLNKWWYGNKKGHIICCCLRLHSAKTRTCYNQMVLFYDLKQNHDSMVKSSDRDPGSWAEGVSRTYTCHSTVLIPLQYYLIAHLRLTYTSHSRSNLRSPHHGIQRERGGKSQVSWGSTNLSAPSSGWSWYAPKKSCKPSQDDDIQ